MTSAFSFVVASASLPMNSSLHGLEAHATPACFITSPRVESQHAQGFVAIARPARTHSSISLRTVPAGPKLSRARGLCRFLALPYYPNHHHRAAAKRSTPVHFARPRAEGRHTRQFQNSSYSDAISPLG